MKGFPRASSNSGPQILGRVTVLIRPYFRSESGQITHGVRFSVTAELRSAQSGAAEKNYRVVFRIIRRLLEIQSETRSIEVGNRGDNSWANETRLMLDDREYSGQDIAALYGWRWQA